MATKKKASKTKGGKKRKVALKSVKKSASARSRSGMRSRSR